MTTSKISGALKLHGLNDNYIIRVLDKPESKGLIRHHNTVFHESDVEEAINYVRTQVAKYEEWDESDIEEAVRDILASGGMKYSMSCKEGFTEYAYGLVIGEPSDSFLEKTRWYSNAKFGDVVVFNQINRLAFNWNGFFKMPRSYGDDNKVVCLSKDGSDGISVDLSSSVVVCPIENIVMVVS